MSPEQPPSDLWKAYRDHLNRLSQSVQRAKLAEFDPTVSAGIEQQANKNPAGQIAQVHADLLAILQRPELHTDEAGIARARELYEVANELTFPAAEAYIEHSQALSGLTINTSLFEVDLDLLRNFDLLAHEDAAFRTFVADMKNILKKAKATPDATAYGQFFEIYAEAVVLHFLRDRGIRTLRIDDTKSAPDFRCELSDGKEFFVEVKTLDIVGGAHRHNAMMLDGLDANVELERQQREGRSIAMTETVIAPYQKPHVDRDYDSLSVERVVNTLRDKCRGAFKGSQFLRGPTFALVVPDRLIIPGREASILPYYLDQGGGEKACVSGVLWHAAFGRTGSPVLRLPEFEGKPSLEGYLTAPGLYADSTQVFPGKGLVVLDKERSTKTRVSYGLKAPQDDTAEWSEADTEEALSVLTHFWNDESSSRGWSVGQPGLDTN